MNQTLTEEESYADRRLLFKHIWNTPDNTQYGEKKKEGNIIRKPKIIKTLRLDEVNRCIGGRKKKQRIRKLKIVCNKLLDFCDRQDKNDMFFAQMAMKGRASPIYKVKKRMRKKSKFIKMRNVQKAKSMYATAEGPSQTGTTLPDSLLYLDISSKNSSVQINVQENNRKKIKRRIVQKLSDTKIFRRPIDKYATKCLFPINKINIS